MMRNEVHETKNKKKTNTFEENDERDTYGLLFALGRRNIIQICRVQRE